MNPPANATPNDTRTPEQKRAGNLDNAPMLPGDATKPSDIPSTVPKSDRSGLPDDTTESTTPPAPQKKVIKQKRTTSVEKTTDQSSTLEHKSDLNQE